MMHIDLANTVIVFDLDDTLYPEADYVASGVRHVCARLHSLYGTDVYRDINSALETNPKVDWLAFACELVGLPNTAKESLLWEYRLHEPAITLSTDVKSILSVLKEFTSLAVLSDGRSVTQRLKLKALGLSDLPLYISQEFGSEKPDLLRFKRIVRDFPDRSYIYVGDNPLKDFVAPNHLGWLTIGLRTDGRNIHQADIYELEQCYLPHYWVETLPEVLKILTEKI